MNKVSIVVPVYNMGSKIETCVQSLVKQTYKNIEIILVDDGSKDDSYAHCKALESIDSRITAYHTENQGSGPARNYGIEHASGEYIYFPDADDYLELNAIEILEKTMRENAIDLIVFGYKNISTSGKLRSVKTYPNLTLDGERIREKYSDYMTTGAKLGIQGAPWNKFFNLSIVNQYNIRYPALRRHQDEGFIARYMSHARSVHFIENVFYTYYTNDLSREWDKYPVDYIDAVTGLYQERKTNILIWNPQDKDVHELVYREYICNFIKALELSFSPKHGMDKKERLKWIGKRVEDSELCTVPVPGNIDRYRTMLLKWAKTKEYGKMYSLLWVKVQTEKSGVLTKIKRFLQ